MREGGILFWNALEGWFLDCLVYFGPQSLGLGDDGISSYCLREIWGKHAKSIIVLDLL